MKTDTANALTVLECKRCSFFLVCGDAIKEIDKEKEARRMRQHVGN
jgi:hypothetical protein